MGSPEWYRHTPVICHPPRRVSTNPDALLKYFSSRPKGRTTSQLPLKLCRMSKFDSARASFKSRGLRMKLDAAAWDWSAEALSIDLENV